MTGRDLIIYILQNNLEDEQVFKDGKFLGLLTVEEAAVRYNTGVATIKVWCQMKFIPSIKIGDQFYIAAIDFNKNNIRSGVDAK